MGAKCYLCDKTREDTVAAVAGLRVCQSCGRKASMMAGKQGTVAVTGVKNGKVYIARKSLYLFQELR